MCRMDNTEIVSNDNFAEISLTDHAAAAAGDSNLFFNILDERNIKTVFQPIISLRDGSIHGYEALSRGPADTAMESPDALFRYAEIYNKVWELEFICRSKALESAIRISPPANLFLNVNPNIMHDPKFAQGMTRECLDHFSINPEKVVFEITEREAIKKISDFIEIVKNYKDQNYKIAIDDAGAGYSGLNLISDIRPHYIKLDMNLIRDVDRDVTKQSLIKSMCEFASLTNTLLIGEGIETEAELTKLIEVGVHYGQGFYIQRPDARILPIDPNVIDLIKDVNHKKNHIYGSRISDIYIKHIARPLATLSSNILVSQIYDLMKSDISLPGYCITSDEYIIGVITRNDLFRIISGQYGYTLYSNKPIKNVMSRSFMCVDCMTTIDTVAKKAMQRDYDKIYDFITITENGKYAGIVTVKELLEKSIEIEILNAKHLNPLSELPGNLLIEQELEKCLKANDGNKYILYFDIDNFKAYNDVYGFENGDRVIKCLTDILKRTISKEDFIGHIGGDDFIAISSYTRAIQICENVIRSFDQSIPTFYNQDDLDKGYITTKNRAGVTECFPMLSISIAGVAGERYKTIYDLAEDAVKLKKKCKETVGSSFLIA